MKLRLLKMQMLLLVARISYDQLIMMRSSDMYTVQFHIDAGRPCYLMNDDLVSKTRTRSSLTLRHHVLARMLDDATHTPRHQIFSSWLQQALALHWIPWLSCH